ncbi:MULTISPECIES: NAD(P)-dependent alcohol dehydrogenase [Microbacterium]|jgi:L-iditol 2-dehydrogenase|uniref:NAD(P)-dependent alcohol dehydrogenase n=1 Tax=Microbacterium paraoxydans TaxID=199592 RepID=A0ABZ2HUM2_9MICO|nr:MULTISPECIES: NAD(P)-dependent alcohol dehydrogenase [Microbacterium]AMG82931.1 sorbitol dehydrogenase [Microbacterium sp. PAMC 28756]MPT13631.1 NAD(P)-dependent alcohol dehydrogenase [Microbacterium sp.]QXE29814.1 NAD(P)-dependent alcohol dehydrogenase [Microbacterium paraoxydans]RUQ05552.1 NAD(P)-dependent alcohol dehydrogenase [Microbacterium sp. HSID17254]
MTEIPTTMTASVLRGVKDLALEERPVPVPAADEVLIEVASVGVCGSDVHYYEHGRIGPYVVDSPLILGHEVSGRIVAVGADVDPARIGRRVAIEPQRPCRRCDFCRAGDYNLCPQMAFYATPPVDGAFCDYVLIQDDFAYDVPDSISDHAAALMEPLSVGIAAAQKGGIKVGDTVLIAGGGPIGIITAQVAKAFGAVDVVIADINPARRELAASYGARTIDPAADSTVELEANVFIDASGATPAIVNGIRSTRAGGTVVLVGSADEFPLSVPEVAMRELNVTGIFRYTGTWPIARALLESGQVELDSLVTHVYGIEQVEEALSGEGSIDSLKRIVLPRVRRVDEPAVKAAS